MPIPTIRRPPPLRRLPPRSTEPARLSTLLAAAVLFAAAEVAAGILVGRVFAWHRAEALLFFAFRPWLLLAGAWFIAAFGWRSRIGFYALALLLAGVAESLLLQALGGDPWAEMLRGWAAGAFAAAVIDLMMQLGRTLQKTAGQVAAAAAVAVLLLVPGGQRPYEWLALGPSEARAVSQKPSLLLFSGLPLVWGETGPFDPDSRPAAAYRALQQEYDVRPIDFVDGRALRGARLMLVAQPRALAPEELVALDGWVRSGGRALILIDPVLGWPSELPLGDPRRPPPVNQLLPLLDHWGVSLEPAPSDRLTIDYFRDGGDLRRLALESPGRFHVSGRECRLGSRPWLARCTLGAGHALLVADADLLRDELWASPGAQGSTRPMRIADNPLVLAGWLDRLASVQRVRSDLPVRWQSPGANRAIALGRAGLPILLALAVALLLRRRGA